MLTCADSSVTPTPNPAPENITVTRLLALLLALAMIAAACGDSDDSSDDAADQATTTAVAADADGDDTTETTEAPTTTAAATGSSDSDWCTASREIAERSDEIEAMGLGFGETLRLQFTELFPRMRAAADNAPSDLDVDFDFYFEQIGAFEELLESVDYQIFNLTEEQANSLDDERMDEIDAAIENYNETVCGITDDPSDEPADIVLTEEDVDALLNGPNRDEILGSLLELGVDEAAAECVMREVLLTGMADAIGANFTDPEFLSTLEDCGLTAADLAEIGLAQDPEEAAEVFEQLAAALPLVAGNPELLLSLFASLGLDAEASQCLADTLAAEGAAEQMADLADFTAVIEGCGVSLEQIIGLAGALGG